MMNWPERIGRGQSPACGAAGSGEIDRGQTIGLSPPSRYSLITGWSAYSETVQKRDCAVTHRPGRPGMLGGGVRFGLLSAFSSWPLGFVASECPARNASTGQVPTPSARTAPQQSGLG